MFKLGKMDIKIRIKIKYLQIDDDQLLRKYKTIWTKIDDFQNIEMLYQFMMIDI